MAKSEAAAKQQQEDQSGAALAPDAPAKPGSYSSSKTDMSPRQLGQGSATPMTGKIDTWTRDHTLDGRIEDDLKVADFYMKNGNYRGAQWRYQDALHYDPANDTALYGVAEALCKRNQKVDAMARLKAYLKAHPGGKHAKDASEMLKHPERCTHNR
jgi:TolA-binding protein